MISLAARAAVSVNELVRCGLIAFGLLAASCASVPAARPGPAADALAHQLARGMGERAWAATGALTWRFAGGAKHLWDRRANVDRQDFGETTVWIDLGTHQGRVVEGGVELAGPEKDAQLAKAYARWANDSFWLNPLAKLFDEGVTRMETAHMSDHLGARGLLIQYASGGVTPGDTYLWIVPPHGPPRHWRLWVSVLPMKGVEVSWDEWVRVETGVWIATAHRLGPLTVRITELDAARDVDTLTRRARP